MSYYFTIFSCSFFFDPFGFSRCKVFFLFSLNGERLSKIFSNLYTPNCFLLCNCLAAYLQNRTKIAFCHKVCLCVRSYQGKDIAFLFVFLSVMYVEFYQVVFGICGR